MAYNKKVFARIRREYESKYLRARAEAEERRNRIELLYPDIAEVDRALAQSGLEMMNAVLFDKNGVSTLAAIREKNTALRDKKRALLEKYGYPQDYTDIKYECAACSDTGYIDNKMCACMRRALILEGYKSSGISELLETQTFDNFSLEYYRDSADNLQYMEKALGFLKKYADGFEAGKSENLLFMGGTGLGKTHLSSAIAKIVIDNGFDVLYSGAPNLVSDFERERFGESTGSSDEDVERYYECDLLIIDDLGVEVTNQFTLSTIYNIINVRMSAKRPTLISTNLSSSELRARYGDRITSRLQGEYRIVAFSGKDIRQQKLSRK